MIQIMIINYASQVVNLVGNAKLAVFLQTHCLMEVLEVLE